MFTAATLIHALKEHWVKIVIAVLCAIAVAAIAKCEREEIRQDETLVKTGEQTAIIRHQSEVLNNVEKSEAAVARPSLDATKRVYDEQDRCANNPECL